jgi:hypothetical protein
MLQFLRRHVDGKAVALGISERRHWLEYDPFALAILLISIGFVELIVLSI